MDQVLPVSRRPLSADVVSQRAADELLIAAIFGPVPDGDSACTPFPAATSTDGAPCHPTETI